MQFWNAISIFSIVWEKVELNYDWANYTTSLSIQDWMISISIIYLFFLVRQDFICIKILWHWDEVVKIFLFMDELRQDCKWKWIEFFRWFWRLNLKKRKFIAKFIFVEIRSEVGWRLNKIICSKYYEIRDSCRL